MKKDEFKTHVMFRRDNDGTIFALFPYNIASINEGYVTCYEHIGQHSGANYDLCINISVPAKENEYQELKSELESIGYNLNVVKRRNNDRYLAELQNARKRG